jgi:hypothetical protein
MSSSSLLDIVRVPQQSLTGSLLVRNLDDTDRKWKISVAILSDDALYLLQPPSIEWIIIPLIHATAEQGVSGGGGVNDGNNINGNNPGMIFTMHTARISFTFKAPSERSAKGWVDAINELSEIANDNALLAAPEHLAEDLLEHAFAQPLIELEAKCEAAERLKNDAEIGVHSSTSSPPTSRPRKMVHNTGRHMDVLKASLPPYPLFVRAALEQYPVFSVNVGELHQSDEVEGNKRDTSGSDNTKVEDLLSSFHWGLSPKPPQSLHRLHILAAAEALLKASAEPISTSSLQENTVTSIDNSSFSSASYSSFSSLQSAPSPLLLEAAYLSCSTPLFVSRSFKLRERKRKGETLKLLQDFERKEVTLLTTSQESPTSSKSILFEGKASPTFSARYGNSG